MNKQIFEGLDNIQSDTWIEITCPKSKQGHYYVDNKCTFCKKSSNKDNISKKLAESIKKVNKMLDEAPVPIANRYFRLGDQEFRTDSKGKLMK